MKKCFALLLTLWLALPVASGYGAQYLADDSRPQAVVFLPAPPGEDDPTFTRDKAVYEEMKALRGSARWDQAIQDASLNPEHIGGYLFLEAFGLPITPEGTPITYQLMRDTLGELAKVLSPAKDHYGRVRPFIYFNEADAICTPEEAQKLSTNGSYPSGHASLGWGMAMLLAEISPDRQDAIFKRGYEVGQSRIVCGVHWQSDVDAAKLLASATLTRLNASPEFQTALQKAREEISAARQTTK